jgi:uncharacterized protein (TIRG00374 family)
MSERDHRPMDAVESGAVPSSTMSSLDHATPATVAPAGSVAPGAPLDAAPDGEPVSLGARLRQPRTLISLILPIILLALVVRSLPGFELDRIPSILGSANMGLLLLAFIVFYLGFPLRGWRWAMLLRGTGLKIGIVDSTEILFLSWLINCLVPAKLGDVYRAFLLKINTPESSLSRTFGTVFIERILDLFAIVILGLAAGFWSFRGGLPPEVQVVFGIGVAVVVLLAGMLFTLRNFGRRILVRLPLPHRILELYDKFEEGVFGAVAARQLPKLAVLTALIWSTEGLRLFLVVHALVPDNHLGLSGAFFVALIGSLLTAVPLSPAGLGIVEAGLVGVLTLAYNIPATEAGAIALVDRTISVLSIIVLGAMAYAVSPKRRGAGLRGQAPPRVSQDPAV